MATVGKQTKTQRVPCACGGTIGRARYRVAQYGADGGVLAVCLRCERMVIAPRAMAARLPVIALPARLGRKLNDICTVNRARAMMDM